MKIGSLQTALRVLACVLILFPHYALAGSVNIPGVHGGAIVPSQPIPQTAPTPARTLNIPGFYGSQLTPPPSNKIPDLKGVVQGANVSNPAQNQVVVDQTEQQAIIDWNSFDIGSDASVQFNQTGKDQKGNAWVGTALNRIWSSDPSRIYGSLKADGTIYLINQNGILFGPGAKVNVNSLVASALNIRNVDFLNNNLLFKYEDYLTGSLNFPGTLPFVSNAGEINAADGGYIFLMAPYVENSGLINAPGGQVGLAAGTNVQLVSPSGTNAPRSGFYVIIDQTDLLNPPSTDQNFGNAVNQTTGELRSDSGMVGMYGNNVDQWGVIRAVTAYQNKKGQVELRALNRVRTGPDSIIMLPFATIDPETGKVKTVDDSFDIQPVVDIKGLQKPASVAGDVPVESDPVKRIELQGIILAPTGVVTMNAAERVYLDVNSQIDVSGVVADLPVPVISNVKLTSVELRDNYAQKSGALPGEKITTTPTAGSSIGDLSQVYLTQERTALERSIGGAVTKNASDGSYKTQTGEVDIASGGDVIMKEGAVIDISGGAIHYAGGPVNTTKLVSGTKIYDISNAPSNIHYDGVLGQYTKTYDRFGISESYTGMYDSGGSPLNRHVDSYTQGGDAGRLTLDSPTIVLDGQIKAGVTRGINQNTWTSSTDPDALALSLARGLEEPRAGTLAIHASSMSIESDPERQSGSISDPEVAPIQTGTTVLSAKTLNAANFGTIGMNADLAFTTAPDASLSLQPGGGFTVQAGRIDHEGSIKVSAGSIDLHISGSAADDNKPQRIVIGAQSSLDVSGERIDNSQTVTNNANLNLGRLDGGSISIKDKTENGDGVFIASGAVVDVSGGYLIDPKGKITGGNAGSLDIQGVNIMVEGDLRGFALADGNGKIKGGSVTLTSKDIRVGPPNTGDVWGPGSETMPVPETMKGKLNLASDRFDETGFTQITLRSMNNVVVGENTTINPSLVRLNNPLAAQQAGSPSSVTAQETFGSPVPAHQDRIKLNDDYAYMAGPSSFSAVAGVQFDGGETYSHGNLTPFNIQTSEGKITVSSGAEVHTTPNSKSQISFKGQGNVDVAGALDSPGGNITVSSGYGDVTLESTSRIIASGTFLPDTASTPKGYSMNYQPVSAGSVVLSAAGSLYMNSGSKIDVSSGDSEVENRMQTADGKIVTYQDAGDPGSLSLSYGSNLAWNGSVDVQKANNNGKGGILTINRTNGNDGLSVQQEDIERYQELGFDDLTLMSRKSLIFADSLSATMGRKLTLDAPVIEAGGGPGHEVVLSAPWIVLTNSNSNVDSPQASATTPVSGEFTLSSTGWMDVIGSVQVNDFQTVTLKADRDIRLSESLYSQGRTSGTLATKGDLVLDANTIYPGNFYSAKDGSNVIYPDIYSNYVIHADGTVTVKNSNTHVEVPIYSAGGNLTVEAGGGIDVEKGGYLAAPLGTITLTTAVNGNPSASGSRIYLTDGSVLTTAGNTAVVYGGIDSNNIWVTESKTQPDDLVYNSTYFTSDSSPPQKGITLKADETVAMKGSVIDVSGGGLVYAYKFQPGAEGSVDPLTKPNRYVAIRSDVFGQPGQTIDLEGAGLSGTYTLLPLDSSHPQNARYAFMPGAYIIEAQSGSVLPGARSQSKDGFPLAMGYSAVADTSIRGTRPQVYSVRTADEVLKTEGNYIMPSFTSGDGGNVTITGNAVVLDGTLKGSAMTGYHGGRISLGSEQIIVQSASSSLLQPDFRFGDTLSDDLKGKLHISGDTVKGFSDVALGDVDETGTSTTSSITVKTGANLEADIISLAASKTTVDAVTGANIDPTIVIESGAQLAAITGNGEINLKTPGKLSIDSDAVVHASNLISLDVNDVDGIRGSGNFQANAIMLKSNAIFFGSGGKVQGDTGLYLTADQLNKFTGFNDITFASRSDIEFRDSFTLAAPNNLTLDAARILDTNTNEHSDVTLNSAIVNLKNSGAASQKTSSDTGTFTATADQINIGGGDVQFNGFSTLSLSSRNDMTLKGTGSLVTNNANLNITAACVVTGADSSSTKQYIAPNFVVDAGTGAITMTGSGVIASATPAPGGLLEIDAQKIELSTVLQSDGGTIKLVTKGVTDKNDDGIFLKSGGQILARGTSDAPGGRVSLKTDYVDASGNMQSGKIKLDAGSLIDVSAGAQGDAGVISLVAPIGGVTLDGIVLGAAQGGKGGSFVLYTNEINSVSPWNDKLIIKTDDQNNVLLGGFTESLYLRARNGNVAIDSDVQAHHFKLTADGGDIDVTGNITADGANGGSVELYAMNDLIVDGRIRAVSVSSNSKDPNVLLSSTQGSININGTIDVSDISGNNASGVVYLRAQRYDNTGQGNDNDVKIYRNNGTLTGYRAIYVEAYKPYNLNTSTNNPDITINSQNVTINGVTFWINDAQNFYSNYSSSSSQNNNVAARLGIQPNSFHLLPGIELFSTGDINWNVAWDQSSANGARFGGEPGVLTLRAGRNLNINQNLVDHPTAIYGLNQSNASGNITYDLFARKSWGFNLIAGADAYSADYLGVIKGKTDSSSGAPAAVGDLNIANGKVVYTESAPINFASGNDTVIGSGYAAGYMINTYLAYSLASYDGSVHSNVGRDLIINDGAIQTATGDIGINVGNDLQLNEISGTLAAIRTTGRLSSTAAFGQDALDPITPAVATSQTPYSTPNDTTTYFWRYIDGGDITLDVGRAVGKSNSSGIMETAINSTQWDYFSKIKVLGIPGQSNLTPPSYGLFSANYGTSIAKAGTRGLAAMGGGDVSVRTGGDFLAQAGTFGDGDLTIQSGGDVNGRFLNHGSMDKTVHAEIHAMGNFGAYDSTKTVTTDGRVQIELFNSDTSISALGDMQIGAIVNPDLASGDIITYRSNFVNCSYTPNTSISLKAGGDATIAGIAPFYHTTNAADKYSLAVNNEIVLPATVSIDAGRDINLLNNFTLASSSTGNLKLFAGGDISGSNGSPVVMMSDIATDYWYGTFYLSDSSDKNGGWISQRVSTISTYRNKHGYYKTEDANKQATAEPIHSGDDVPIVIHADGDIRDMIYYLPKKAEVTAGRDIIDIIYEGQNINPDDVSMIQAGRSISVKYVKDTGTPTTTSDEALHKGLIQGGPGVFLVQAGDSIDLGTLPDGIQSIGNVNNPILGPGNSSIMVLSGYDPNKTVDVAKFFKEIRESGDLYGMLLAGGTHDAAEKLVNSISTDTDAQHTDAYNTIVRLREKAGGDEDQFYKMLTSGGDKEDAEALLKDTRAATSGMLTPTGTGDINMTSTQISTSSGKSGVNIIANGNLNLGKTALPIAGAATKATGVTTNGGGSVNVFTKGDVNVNESRIMTFYGGDITVWSDNGNINAGRGSRTAVSPPKTRKIKTATGYMTVYDPPSVGSGIRAVTYGDNPPPPGNIHLFAPSGIIDAAEAGIAGGQIFLAALKINNAANINFSMGSIGVPQSASGTANIGAMTGAGMVAQGSQLASEASGIAASRAQASQMMEDIMTKWLDVKVIDFVQQDDNTKEEEK